MARPRHQAITLLLVFTATASLLLTPGNARTLQGTHMRRLAADAKADSSSTGGTALSVSDSQGKSDVTTTSTASNGGTAAAIKSASNDASHVVSSAADGNSSFTYSSSTPHSKDDVWDSAPACRNSSTATFDASMRLWGWENNAPCAFKEEQPASGSSPAGTPTGSDDAWNRAPPCKQADTSATKDNSGRLWGWENGASCAFKASGDGGDAVWEAAKPCAAPATGDNINSTDNRGRKWGWENGASCAFKGTSARKMLSLVGQLNIRPMHDTHPRQLLADAKADASSTGGIALSVSDSQGKSDVTTTSTASNGGTAVAVKSASNDASHLVSSAADGNSSFTYSSSTPHSKDDAWDSAPPCKQADTSATKDNSGRLWGWEDGASCAFKAPGDGGDAVWEAAKPCAAPATADNVKSTDNRGRKWGWENSASCAFKGTATRKMLTNMPLVTDLSGGSDNTAGNLLAANAAVPAEEYAEDGPADSSTPNTLPTTNAPAEDYTVEEDPASDPASNSNITGPEALNSAANVAIPAANSAASSDLAAPAADPADNSSTDVDPATLNTTNAAADVPALDEDYDVAHTTTPDIIVGGVKGATDSFGKPITTEVLSADNAAVTPPAEATSASPTPAAAVDITTASPAPATSPEPAAASPSPAAAPAASSAPTWETAPICVGPPTKQTSVQDLNGRLWWVVPSSSTWSSCTYRAADGTAVYYEGYQQVQFDSAPACQHLADTTNAMADASGRLWGWAAGQAGDGANCRFLKAGGTPVMQAEVFMV